MQCQMFKNNLQIFLLMNNCLYVRYFVILILAFMLISVTYVAESYNIRQTLLARGRSKPANENDLCIFGSYQTPIHFQNNAFQHMVMPAIDFLGYNNYLPPPITVTNTGRTVKLTAGQYLEDGLYSYPSITGGLLNGYYVWDSIHFHWGKDNNRGSEHVINNIRHPLEMHVVHRRSNYSTRDEALESKDGLAVLGFFFELQVGDNRKLEPIIGSLKHVPKEGDVSELQRSFSLFTLLPRKTDIFFTYEGSLSSPPCSESVIWIVFLNPIRISFRQMEQFRTLSIPENYRNLQPIGQRKVFLRQTKRFTTPDFEQFSRKNVSSNFFWLKLR